MPPKNHNSKPAASTPTPLAKAIAGGTSSTPVTRKASATQDKSKLAATTRAKKPGRAKPKAVLPVAVPTEPSYASKQDYLIAMLRTPSGASIEQMMSFTGWQAHTVRGTISGILRKKLGLNVTCTPSDESGTRRYRIVESVTA